MLAKDRHVLVVLSSLEIRFLLPFVSGSLPPLCRVGSMTQERDLLLADWWSFRQVKLAATNYSCLCKHVVVFCWPQSPQYCNVMSLPTSKLLNTYIYTCISSSSNMWRYQRKQFYKRITWQHRKANNWDKRVDKVFKSIYLVAVFENGQA